MALIRTNKIGKSSSVSWAGMFSGASGHLDELSNPESLDYTNGVLTVPAGSYHLKVGATFTGVTSGAMVAQYIINGGTPVAIPNGLSGTLQYTEVDITETSDFTLEITVSRTQGTSQCIVGAAMSEN